ncbi:LutC/YkgG family protein [Mucilaginibacter glaciei]|uniref:LUD domain-containing protein n=1 Tax=Mucilaginibacter glaciei TaxID=2772109 RepID=A0A926NQX5_9SPHI|nr:LUD domain-containing protein [Mucilaginibacter glaciei]MBD1394366.1 LUD domain-containing protein [Mucilaginibacter glaciei]
MTSREKILAAVQANQPDLTALPDLSGFDGQAFGSLAQFAEVLTAVGGKIFHVANYAAIIKIILAQYGSGVRIVTQLEELKKLTRDNLESLSQIHDLHDVEVAIIAARFGVAENGAVWITEEEMQHRVVPFIAQHLAVIIHEDAIVPTMHQAYDRIANTTYNFGTFIAGPSKTADIEQSLVIGAHGPRSMTVFVLKNS